MAAASPSAAFIADLVRNVTPDSVSIRTTSTVNDYGERTWTGGTTSYDAYVRRANEADRDANVDNIDYDYVAYIPSSSLTLNVADEITLPAPLSAIRPIVKVETRKDALGQVAVIAYVGTR